MSHIQQHKYRLGVWFFNLLLIIMYRRHLIFGMVHKFIRVESLRTRYWMTSRQMLLWIVSTRMLRIWRYLLVPYRVTSNMHHVRQSHVNPAFPSHGVNSRNNSAGYIDHNAPHRNAQTNHQVTGHVTGNVAQRMSVPLPRSPQYMESNGRNPSVSSAMALHHFLLFVFYIRS
jgi:hypothetical protein